MTNEPAFTYTLPRTMAMMVLQLSSRVTPAEFPGLHATLEQQFADQQVKAQMDALAAHEMAVRNRLIAEGWSPPPGQEG